MKIESQDMPDVDAEMKKEEPYEDDIDEKKEDVEDAEEDDDLENFLEDVLETAAAEEEFAKKEEEDLKKKAPPPLAMPLQVSTDQLLENLPRTADGQIDVHSLSSDDRKIYNAGLVSLLTEDQMDRYEAYRTATLKDPIRKLIQAVAGVTPSGKNACVIALAGAAKVFVGELIEEAREIAASQGATGPLQPVHIHAAFQKLKEKGIVEGVAPGKKNFTL